MATGFDESKIGVRANIRNQLQDGRRFGAAWMIRMMNTTTGEIFPVYVQKGRSPQQEFATYVRIHGDNFNPIECYDFSKDLENQVQEDLTQNWDRQLPVQTGNFSAVVPFIGNGPNMVWDKKEKP